MFGAGWHGGRCQFVPVMNLGTDYLCLGPFIANSLLVAVGAILGSSQGVLRQTCVELISEFAHSLLHVDDQLLVDTLRLGFPCVHGLGGGVVPRAGNVLDTDQRLQLMISCGENWGFKGRGRMRRMSCKIHSV